MFAVVQFPGSNDDRDLQYAMKAVIGVESQLVWHKQAELPPGTCAVLLPGGFSYGDYLRGGAMARFSPIMGAVRRHAEAGGMVLGICNGFQVLCESGLLPGALLRNRDLHFICKSVYLKVEDASHALSPPDSADSVLRIPIKHREGRYFVTAEQQKQLEANKQIWLRYSNAQV